MGRIYENLRRDIEKLRQVDQAIKNKQLINMDDIFAVSVAMQKIQYVLVYAEHENPDLFFSGQRLDFGDMENFNLPNDFEEMVNGFEEGLGEERTNEALRHLGLQDQLEPYVPELTKYNPRAYYEYVRDTIDDIANINVHQPFGISHAGVAYMALSAREDFVKTIVAQDFAYEPENSENKGLYDFLRDPIRVVIRDHGEGLDDRGDFIEDQNYLYEDVIQNSEHPEPADEVENLYSVSKALAPIHKAKWTAKGLDDAIKTSITGYMKNRHKQDPSVGEFISKVRDRIEASLLDHAVILGDDANSDFIKRFMKDPIAAMEKHYNDKAADKRIGPSPEDRARASRIRDERQNYEQARVGKVDRYAQMLESRKHRFEEAFNQTYPNFDPARFKSEYSGSTFERFLGRTSKEWTALSDYVDSWKNVGQERDLDKATDLAEKYLRHKFPKTEPKDVTEDMIASLHGAGRERSRFCLNLIHGQAYAEQEENQAIYEAANRRFDELEARLHRGANFQEALGNQIDNENDIEAHANNNIINNNIIENNNDLEDDKSEVEIEF